jgi:hypothetical protein
MKSLQLNMGINAESPQKFLSAKRLLNFIALAGPTIVWHGITTQNYCGRCFPFDPFDVAAQDASLDVMGVAY